MRIFPILRLDSDHSFFIDQCYRDALHRGSPHVGFNVAKMTPRRALELPGVQSNLSPAEVLRIHVQGISSRIWDAQISTHDAPGSWFHHYVNDDMAEQDATQSGDCVML